MVIRIELRHCGERMALMRSFRKCSQRNAELVRERRYGSELSHLAGTVQRGNNRGNVPSGK